MDPYDLPDKGQNASSERSSGDSSSQIIPSTSSGSSPSSSQSKLTNADSILWRDAYDVPDKGQKAS